MFFTVEYHINIVSIFHCITFILILQVLTLYYFCFRFVTVAVLPHEFYRLNPIRPGDGGGGGAFDARANFE